MFKRLELSDSHRIEFTFDGQRIAAVAGDSVAAALLHSGVTKTRHTLVSGSPRAPYCMMGTCYECQVVVDGFTVQACMTPVQENLVVHRVAGTTADD